MEIITTGPVAVAVVLGILLVTAVTAELVAEVAVPIGMPHLLREQEAQEALLAVQLSIMVVLGKMMPLLVQQGLVEQTLVVEVAVLGTILLLLINPVGLVGKG